MSGRKEPIACHSKTVTMYTIGKGPLYIKEAGYGLS